MILIFRGILLQYCTFDPAEMDCGDSQIGSDIMLGNSPDDLGAFFGKADIPLFGCIFYKREKMFHVIEHPFKKGVHKLGPQFRIFIYLC